MEIKFERTFYYLQLQLYNFFNALLIHMPEAAKRLTEHDDLSTSSAGKRNFRAFIRRNFIQLNQAGCATRKKTARNFCSLITLINCW